MYFHCLCGCVLLILSATNLVGRLNSLLRFRPRVGSPPCTKRCFSIQALCLSFGDMDTCFTWASIACLDIPIDPSSRFKRRTPALVSGFAKKFFLRTSVSIWGPITYCLPIQSDQSVMRITVWERWTTLRTSEGSGGIEPAGSPNAPLSQC